VVAMLFIIFDIETIFLFPWAVSFRRLGLFGLVEMVVFIGLVFVAYVYVWQKGGLEWDGPGRQGPAGRAVSPGLPPEVERSPGEAAPPLPSGAPRLEEPARAPVMPVPVGGGS
jgi:NADH-ubiquinone/plastoquinone oxidoreductase, chain 3